MTYARSLRGSFTVLGLWLGLSGATAQTPAQPAVPAPPLFSRIGVINRVDTTDGVIVISDVRYRLPESIRVYTYDRTLKEQEAQRAEARLKKANVLREGLRVGYNVTGEGSGRHGTVTEAWLLPPGKIPGLQSGEHSTEQGKGNRP